MGCVASTEVITDPVTGEAKKKKKLGGAYPGQMGHQHQPYQPPASAFQNGKATAHFVSYGGGNALTLVRPDGSTKPQHGGPESQYIMVTLPPGVEPGQKIHVQAPDGRLNEIIIPPGFGPGSSFTVEFAPASAAPPSASPATIPANDKIPSYEAAVMNNTRPAAPSAPYATASTNGNNYVNSGPPPPQTNHVDDGFASGFNNPGWTPPPVYAASATPADPNINLSSYPTSQAVPITNSNYPPPPAYAAQTY